MDRSTLLYRPLGAGARRDRRRRRAYRAGGADSVAIPWAAVVEAAPQVLVLGGYSVERTVADLPILRPYPGFEALPTAQCGEVYVVDGSAYFSRPGPRIADSLEILAEILHPESFRGRSPDRGVARVA